MKQYVFRVEEGEQLIASLQKHLKQKGILNGQIISVIGALRDFKLVTIYQDSEKIPPDHFEKDFDRKVEITGNGIIRDGCPHIHIVCGQEEGPALAGHLVEGTVTYFADIGVLVG